MSSHIAPRSFRYLPMVALLAVNLIGAAGGTPCAAAKPPAPTLESLTVSPAALEFRHHSQPHALQVLAATADGYSLDLRAQAKFTVADPKIATGDDQGWVRPVAN